MTLQIVLTVLLHFGAPKSTAPAVADAIAAYAQTPQEAAFMAALGKHESNFAQHLIAGRCKSFECDARKLADGSVEFRALGAWQVRRGFAGASFDDLPGNLELQARIAARMTRFALKRCAGTKHPIRGAFATLGGLSCDGTFKGIDERVADYERALKEMKADGRTAEAN